jgi:NAD(P)-dependent dehydrogenase (short-subunit alcohol dehydrogenase family)
MGKYVIVGASQGIGESIASTLLSAGHEVINFSRNPSFITGVINYTWDALGADDSTIAAITGPVDGIAYCPGSINLKPFHRLTSADFEKDFQINVLGAVRVIQALLPALKQSVTSSIVLFSTVAVQTGMGFHASIASSKGTDTLISC